MMTSCNRNVIAKRDHDAYGGDEDSFLGDLAPYREPAASRSLATDGHESSISSVTLEDESCCESMLFEKNNKSSGSNNLFYSRWEMTLGDSNSNIVYGHAFAASKGAEAAIPSFIFILSVGDKTAGATGPLQREWGTAAMAVKMPQRQQTSHIRNKEPPLPLSTIASTGTLSFGESLQDESHFDEKEHRVPPPPPPPPAAPRLSPRLVVAKFKRPATGLVKALTAASNHTLAAYSLGRSTNHTFASYSKGSSSNPTSSSRAQQGSNHTFAARQPSSHHTLVQHTSNHTFASFASSTHHSSSAGVLSSTWESVLEDDDSTAASFSSEESAATPSLPSMEQPSSLHSKVVTLRRRHSVTGSAISSVSCIHSVAGHDRMSIQPQQEQ
jgi:hypothetical protein